METLDCVVNHFSNAFEKGLDLIKIFAKFCVGLLSSDAAQSMVGSLW